MTQHCDDWSPYYNTLVGQFEYWTLTIMREAFRRNLDNWPSTYYGYERLNAAGINSDKMTKAEMIDAAIKLLDKEG